MSNELLNEITEHPHDRFNRDYPDEDLDYERTFVHRARERNERLYVDAETGISALDGVGYGPGWDFFAGRPESGDNGPITT